jgi:2-iminobutanoate/2-iminopropanoate deaminase
MRDPFTSNKLQKPKQPYSHGIITSGKQLWLSGILPINHLTGEMVDRDFLVQAKQVFENLKDAVESAGANLNQAIKVNVFLYDTNDHFTMNEVFAQYFSEPFPARTTIQSTLRASLIEVDAVIALDD